jgi:hypothetical protein
MHRGMQSINGRARQQFFGGAVFAVEGMPEVDEHPETIVEAPQLPAPQPAPEIQPLRNLVISRLIAAAPESEELRAAKLALVADASVGKVDLSEADLFLAAVEEESLGQLRVEHRQVRKEGRAQQALCERLYAEFVAASVRWDNASQLKAKSIDAVHAARYQREHMSRWATDSEIKAADATVGHAQVLASRATEASARALQVRNGAEQQLLDARAELSRLAGQEQALRACVEGRAFIDPELGLSSVPNAGA